MRMSVLIKGMGMPICRTCPVCDEKLFGNYCRITKEIVSFGFERGEKCPLIELQPHGRLVDADELMKPKNQYYEYAADEWYVRVRTIESAPTILEAEVEEEAKQ